MCPIGTTDGMLRHMAAGMLDALQLRNVKYGANSQPSQQVAAAAKLLASGRVAEAFDLYEIADDKPGMDSVRKQAQEDGRPVLLIMLQHAGQQVQAEEWSACGEAAYRASRWREAYRAFLAAEDEGGLERVREKIPGYEIYVPQGK
jgi:hypothetical protein